MPNPQKTKSERIDLRTSVEVKHLLQQAARASHKNVSEFLLDAGVVAAHQALADRRLFFLDEKRWKEFQGILDRPVQDSPAMRNLLNEPSILDD